MCQSGTRIWHSCLATKTYITKARTLAEEAIKAFQTEAAARAEVAASSEMVPVSEEAAPVTGEAAPVSEQAAAGGNEKTATSMEAATAEGGEEAAASMEEAAAAGGEEAAASDGIKEGAAVKVQTWRAHV